MWSALWRKKVIEAFIKYSENQITSAIMIKVSKLNKETFFLNPMLIEKIEITPDVLLTLINGKKILVKENKEYIIESIMKYWQAIFHLQKKKEYFDSIK